MPDLRRSHRILHTAIPYLRGCHWHNACGECQGYQGHGDCHEGEQRLREKTVPNVVGQQDGDAQNAITAAGLTVGTVTYEYYDDVRRAR